jgi:hypothetical protein
MTASIAYDPKRLTGYQLEQLAAAFDRVRDPRDWKAPIEAVIAAAERPLVEQAVLWFTDTVPVFSAIAGTPDRLAVRAKGYRLGETETRNGHLREDSRQVIARMGPAGAVVVPREHAAAVPAALRTRRRFAPAETTELAGNAP